MFEGLNAIPWHALTHAYGSAEEVPMWLRQLASPDASVRKPAMNHLEGSICHQGWICPATGYAVPYLIELLEAPETEDKDEILSLLNAIALAGPLSEPYWRHNPSVPSYEVSADIPFQDAQAAVRAGMPTYRALLFLDQPRVRMAAANLLSHYAASDDDIRPLLLSAFHAERDERVRANLLRALSAPAEDAPEQRAFYEDTMRRAPSAIERFCAACALARLAHEETPDAAVDLLFSEFVQPSETLKSQCAQIPEMARPDVVARFALYQLGPARLKFAAPTVCHMIAAGDTIAAFVLIEFLLFILFDGKPSKEHAPRPAASLTSLQREGLVTLLNRADVWADVGDKRTRKAYGLPIEREDMAAYLDLPVPSEAEPATARPDSAVAPPEPEPDRFSIYHHRIKAAYPDLPVSPIGGAASVDGMDIHPITVGKNAIFFFPVNDAGERTLRREEALLRVLGDKVPLPIPNPQYTSREAQAPGIAFFGYEKLPGKPLHREMLESVDGDDARLAAIDQIGAFLVALHQISPAALDPELPNLTSRDALSALYERVREQLFPTMPENTRTEIAAAFDAFLSAPESFTATNVLIHGDFRPQNILYNASARTVSGIIGWEHAGIGDPAADIAGLLPPTGYDDAFLSRLAETYPLNGALLARARFYAGALALREALTHRERGYTSQPFQRTYFAKNRE